MQTSQVVQKESRVRVFCKISSLETNETIVDDNTTPIEINLLNDDVIVGLYGALMGMKPGEKKNKALTPIEGYGKYYKELCHEVKKEEFSADFEIELGKGILITHENDSIPGIITKVMDNSVILDTNHPFSGHRLNLEVDLVEIL